MEKEQFNNFEIERKDDKNIYDSPNRQNKSISTRKRKQLINRESDEDEDIINKNNPLEEMKKEECKEEDITDNKNENILQNNKGNKYKTIDTNNIGSTQVKDNSRLQEKLKKIFMNRDKVKFQYSKQDIPDNLKYHSDESETSEISALRKSKIKNNNANNNLNLYSNHESQKTSKLDKTNDSVRHNTNNELKKSEEECSTFSPAHPAKYVEEGKNFNCNKNEENENEDFSKANKIQINEEKKIASYNEEDENKLNEKKINKYKYERSNFKYNNKWNDEEEKVEENDVNRKESDKKNILLKVFENREKHDEINENRDKNRNEGKNKEKNNDDDKKEKKRKLLKMLFDKKESNTIENDEENEEFSQKDKAEIEKENRRRRIIEQLQSESSNPSSNKKMRDSGKKAKFGEKSNKKDKQKNEEEGVSYGVGKEENEDEDPDDKGTYLSNMHKNRLTISIGPKSNLFKQFSSSSFEENNEKEKINKEEEREMKAKTNKNNKSNFVHDILTQLKKKKTEQQFLLQKENEEINNIKKDVEINDSEVEREAEKIRKKEKRMEERRLARENQKNSSTKENEKEENNINNEINNRIKFSTSKRRFYNRINKNNNDNKIINEIIDNNSKNKEIEKQFEEKNKKKPLEKEPKKEINVFAKKNSTSIINSFRINNSPSNTQKDSAESQDKFNQKIYNTKPIQVRNNQVNFSKIIDEGAAPNEIIINDLQVSNLDRSFDTGNTYMKRKIIGGKNTLNIYKPKKVDLRGRSQERISNDFIENNSNSFNPNLIENYNKFSNKVISSNFPNKLTYVKKKSSGNVNTNFIMNNNSFYENPKQNKLRNTINDRNNINIQYEIAGALNSSFDAYMNNMNINSINNINNSVMTSPRNLYNTKKINNWNYNRATYAPVNNNINKNYGNQFYKKGIISTNDANRSLGYININEFNDDFENNNFYNDNEKYHSINNNNNDLINKTKRINTKNNIYTNSQKSKYIPSYNNIKNSNFYRNSPLNDYSNKLNKNVSKVSQSNYYHNSPEIKRYEPTKSKGKLNNINNDNYNYNNSQHFQQFERDTSINIEDLLVLEEKLNEIIISLNRNHVMHNECFEFLNYYFNCSFYGKLETLFKNENDCSNVRISINHILISVMICYDFSFEMEVLNGEYSILDDILELNHRNLIIIYDHILSKISSESKFNSWVQKLHQLVGNFNKNDDSEYISMNGRKLSNVEKITYNVSVIVQNIRVLLKNYKTKRIEYLTSIFKKVNEKTYEEINSYFIDKILRVDNVNGSVLASVFLKENKNFQTEPAPYIKTKNRKKYSLILDLDETLVHFKMNNEDESEGVLQIRPGVISFLEQVGKFYELIVFTAATQDYGDLLIDAIEENNLYFEHRFYRQHTVIIGNDFVKDLNRIGRPLDKIIIVDNMPQNFRLQKENGINIKAFWGEDSNDNALEELGKILINIAKDGGDVRVGLEKYRDEIVKKVTSNISKTNY